MYVSEIMTKDVITVKPDQTLADLRQLLAKHQFHHLLVEENGELVGVISDRDVSANSSPYLGTLNERSEDRDLLDKQVEEMMSTEVVVVDEDTIIDCASILLLENNISCLPVIDDTRKILGIITWKDILQYHVYEVDRGMCIRT
jgi:acetoin utilization protein AcuB